MQETAPTCIPPSSTWGLASAGIPRRHEMSKVRSVGGLLSAAPAHSSTFLFFFLFLGVRRSMEIQRRCGGPSVTDIVGEFFRDGCFAIRRCIAVETVHEHMTFYRRHLSIGLRCSQTRQRGDSGRRGQSQEVTRPRYGAVNKAITAAVTCWIRLWHRLFGNDHLNSWWPLTFASGPGPWQRHESAR